jgi:molybdopterin synthase catalytic subunit
MDSNNVNNTPPSIDEWLAEAKAYPTASEIGMFLVHNGVVRETPKAQVRQGLNDGSVVKSLDFSYDAGKVDQAVAEAKAMAGIFYVKAWLNAGRLKVGDDIMLVLIGGDIRPNVVNALQFLVEKIKTECVTEIEHRNKD